MSTSKAAPIPIPTTEPRKEPLCCQGSPQDPVADLQIKERHLKRLRRIEGQVRGIQRMIQDDRFCPDVLVQIASVQEALRGVSREVMRTHICRCAAGAAQEGGDAAETMQGELLDMMYRYLS
jgi:CsoR family transcriptional regulator, copper-sensing transcriptional repressor